MEYLPEDDGQESEGEEEEEEVCVGLAAGIKCLMSHYVFPGLAPEHSFFAHGACHLYWTV